MSFRGFGDDAMKVQADQRATRLKEKQIAASERDSIRGNQAQMASIGARKFSANLANRQAGEQLDFQKEQAAQQLQANEAAAAATAAAKVETDRKAAVTAAKEEEKRKIDLELKLKEQSRDERQLQLNERVAARLEQEWRQKQAVQEEIKNVGKATHLAVMRAAVRADGPVDQVFVNAWNSVLNVGPGDTGYVKQITAVRDPKTQENYGVGFLSVGQDGKDVYTVKDPGDIMPLLRASMSAEAWDKWSYDTLNQRKSAGIDATSAAILKERERGKLELSAKQALEIAKGAQGLSEDMDPKTDKANLDKIEKITSGALDAAAGAMEGPQPEQPAQTFSLEDQALFTWAETEAKGDKAKTYELFKAAKAKQAEVAKRRAGGGETPADAPAASTAPKDGGDLTSKIEELNAKGEFDTKLAPSEEAEFKVWKQKYAPKDSGMDYDLRGAFKAGEKPGADGHWTDKFKKPNHPTFSDQSQYAEGEFKRLAGTWKGDKFVPSAEKAGGSAPEAKKLAASQALRRQNATKSTPAKAGGSAPASQPATKNAGKQKSWTTPSSTPLFEAGADGKRGKANVEPGKDTQRLGSNKAPAAAEKELRLKLPEVSLTDEDSKALSKIYNDSFNQEPNPDTGLIQDPKIYYEEKVKEYFDQKLAAVLKRLSDEGKFETEFK
jgi:hypothetical protein